MKSKTYRIRVRDRHKAICDGIDRVLLRLSPVLKSWIKRQRKLAELPIFAVDQFVIPGPVLMQLQIKIDEAPRAVLVSDGPKWRRAAK